MGDPINAVIDVLLWRPESSIKYGEIKADLERSDKIIDDFNIAIAAIAMSHQYGVLTANLKHFERIKDIDIKSW